MDLLQQRLEHFFPKLSKSVRVALEKKSIFTAQDMLYHLPSRYEKRSSYLSIYQALEEHGDGSDRITIPTIKAECQAIDAIIFRSRRIKKYIFNDGEAMFSVLAFNPFQNFKEGETYLLSGKLKFRKNELQMNVAEYELFRDNASEKLGAGKIIGIYSSTQYLKQKHLRDLAKGLLLALPEESFVYDIDAPVLAQKKLQSKKENIQEQHFPKNFTSLKKAREELVYEEFYTLQKKLAEERKRRIQESVGHRYAEKESLREFIKNLPFQLTLGQKKALQEILCDMEAPLAMHRLIQGEVGSGKTLLALIAMYYASLSGYQSALMAPTEILVMQHEQFFHQQLKDFNVPIIVVLGHQSARERDMARLRLAEESNAIVLGSHALIQESIQFQKLALGIIDEQQRFGVDQRKAFMEKGKNIDFMSLSATPIPRSLCLTLFGDMERSEIHERPKTQKTVKCRLISESQRVHAYRFLYSRLQQGEQGYVVFPVIDEKESSSLRSLSKEYNRLTRKAFQSIETAFIHGRMKSDEKEHLMKLFYAGEIKVLFSTSVMEVGISHDNATVIIIESAQQFGLSQLHQLRGRVGRAEKQGYCYLISNEELKEESYERLQKFAENYDGFQIAELDLELRGPGQVLGQRQSGTPEFKIADMIKDLPILQMARKDARQQVLGHDLLEQHQSDI